MKAAPRTLAACPALPQESATSNQASQRSRVPVVVAAMISRCRRRVSAVSPITANPASSAASRPIHETLHSATMW
jgi:hypothetical protein